MNPSDNIDLKALAKVIQKRENVLLAYIFGSQVTSTRVQKPSSDIDIAILFTYSPPLRELLSFRAELTQLLETDSVDLVSLNEASPLLKYEVIVGGKTIYTGDPLLQSRFEMRTISHFLDTRYLRNVQNHYLLGEGL